MKIVVIIPTFNEKANMEKMIPVLEGEVFPKIKGHEMEILVADDGSPDGTKDVVEAYMKKYKNLHLIEGKKEGLGAAYARAMKYAMDKLGAGAVIEFDADFQHDPNDIPKLIAAMDEGYDYVIGSRYIKGGQIPKEWGIDRKILSIVGSLFTRIVWLKFSIHDMTSGFKLTKISYLKQIDLDNLLSNDFAYKMHILHDVVKLGAKVKEVPIIFYERTEGASKINKKDQLDSLYVVLRLRARDSEKFLKFLVVGGFGFLINAIILRLLVDGAHWNPSLANLVGAVAAIFSNYNFNNLWTFNTNRAKTVGQYIIKLLQFYTTSAIGVIFIQTGTIFVGDNLIGRQFYFEYFLFGTFLLLIWNFTVYNRFIWKKK